ncbi:Similar to Cdan1: Codanin-1 (Mus musculus) [Cotesia congregata]|uniref:Similar to Cdan1: Codanin-1 (Mus musculus) n=1 Tax=Cotesia congregata TaxID=51543 RepID=A0A8J2HJ81_COTCN|nr:Similar to Cdan1: Codanin-1 (Mus musculus) [Cotesia congregata]
MDVLNKILNSEISIDEILEWLSANDNENINFSNNAQINSTPTEFILFFLNYLRKQCQGTLDVDIHNTVESQVKKNIPSTPSKQNKSVNRTRSNISLEDNKQLKLSSVCTGNQNSSLGFHSPDTKIANISNNIQLTSTPVKTIHQITQSSESTNLNTTDKSEPRHTVDCMSSFNELSQSFSPIIKHSRPQWSNDDHSFGNPEFSVNRQSTLNISPHVRQPTINDSVHSNTSIDTSVNPCSPVSPLYTGYMPSIFKKKNYAAIKQRATGKNLSKSSQSKQNTDQKKNDHSRSICFGDFIAPEKSNSKKNNKKNSSKDQVLTSQSTHETEPLQNKSLTENTRNKSKSRRRIKPTKLNLSSDTANQEEVFGAVSRPRIVNPQFVEAQPNDKSTEISSFETERELLKLERQKQPKVDVSTEGSSQEVKCVIKSLKPSSYVVPQLEFVDNIEVLNILGKLYASLLCKNLILNPMSELYFIISLITFQYKSLVDENESPITHLNSESNNSNSLDRLKKNLGVFDIVEDINEISCNRESQKNVDDSELSTCELVDKKKIEQSQDEPNYLDTAHNCIYFATTTLFHGKSLLSVLDRAALKLLYDNTLVVAFQPALREYLKELYTLKCLHSKQCKPYNDASALQTNVCFQMDTDNRENFPSSLAFSTFRKQRDVFYEILKIWEDNHLLPNWSFNTALERKINTLLSMHHDQEQLDDDQTSNVLKYLKDLDPEKLKQLKERLVTPTSSKGPVPEPEFLGVQEFYRDFISASFNPKFNVILQNCFVQEIIELNETQFACSDIDTKENSVDESTKQNYIICLSSLRVMAKFLGFIISLPFRSEVKTLESINTQIALRSRTLPPLDLQECLSNSMKNGKLSLTIPWLVQYLAMMDSVAFYLPYYLKLCKILYCLYRTAYNSLNQETSLLITFCIGWLFDLPNFPKELYYNWYSNYNNVKIETKPLLTISKSIETSKLTDKTSKNVAGCNIILDGMKIIDDRALFISCEFLTEFKVLLTAGNSSIHSGNNANRHITPVSSQLSKPTHAARTITLELQLENAFFHSQPRSIKKTVDFVSERVASTCVKYICKFIITPIKEKSYKTWKIQISKKPSEQIVATDELFQHITVVTHEISNECKKKIPAMCEARIKNSIESLLAEDILESVKNMSIKIAMKMAMERINQWIESYINGVTTSKDMYEEFVNKKSFDSDEDSKNMQKSKYDSRYPSSTTVINDVRNSMWELMEQNGRWSILTEEQILLIIDSVQSILLGNNELVMSTKKVLCILSIDYAIHIIVFKEELMTTNIENNFIKLWKLYKNINELLSGLLSPRNIKLLMQAYDATIWRRYGKFIQKLLAENILTIENFSDQCVAFFRLEWPRYVLKCIPNCLLEAISHYNSFNEHTEKVKYLIGWLAGTCPELNYNYG